MILINAEKNIMKTPINNSHKQFFKKQKKIQKFT